MDIRTEIFWRLKDVKISMKMDEIIDWKGRLL